MSLFLPESLVTTNVPAESVASFFLQRDAERADADVTQMKLHKLMYYAQGSYLASTGRRLFDSSLEAFEHGPVVEDVRNIYNQYGRDIIVVADSTATIPSGEFAPLPSDVEEYLERIWRKFGDFSASHLRAMSHKDAPWKDNYKSDGFHCNIPDEEIAAWFRSENAKDKYVPLPNQFLVDEEIWNSLDDEDDEEFLSQWVKNF